MRGKGEKSVIEYRISDLEAGQRLDKFLKKFLKEAPGSFLYKMLRKKNIVCNGKKASGSEMLSVGDQICLYLSDETIQKFGGFLPSEYGMEEGDHSPENKNSDHKNSIKKNGTNKNSDIKKSNHGEMQTDSKIPMYSGQQDRKGKDAAWSRQIQRWQKACQSLEQEFGTVKILYEDQHILVADKPCGVLTQGGESGEASLNDWLIGHLLQTEEITALQLRTFRPSACHRLDRNTTGMVICSKTLAGSQCISSLLRERKIGKYYLAYVKGRVTEEGHLEGYLQKDGRINKAGLVSSKEQGDAICTEYRPISHGRDRTLLEIHLITGKTHQIRLHLSSIGHPVLGDYKYGDRRYNDFYKKEYGISSQLLHAGRLEFPVMEHPFQSLSELVLKAPLPDSFRRLESEEG